MLSPSLSALATAAVTSGAEALFARQRPDGVFAPGGDRFSPGNTAVALIALTLAGRTQGAAAPVPQDEQDETVARAVDRLCAAQRADGGWAMAGVPTEVLTTAVVVAALQLAAPERTSQAAAEGLDALEALGGPQALPEPTMTSLIGQFEALAGRGDADALPRLPLWLVTLRGLSRRVLSLRLPIFASMALAQSVQRRQGPLRERVNRAAARPVALGIVRDAYEREGATGAFSTDPWLTSLISIGVTRSALAPDVSAASAARLRAMAAGEGGWDLMPLDVTWTNFALGALLEAGYADDPRLAAARTALRERQQDVPFDSLGCPPGFWGFSSARSWPMALETAESSAALLRLPDGADDEHARLGIRWLTTMQDKAGSWSLAVRDSKPGGFGPCPYMTAKAVCALLTAGVDAGDRRVVRALRWLAKRQEADGSVESLWYRGGTPGTAAVLEAYCRAGAGSSATALRAREWLLGAQGQDGSWGTGQYGEPGTGTGSGTVEETGWALHALLAAGTGTGDGGLVAAAGRWLVDAQRADGSWRGSAVNEYVRGCLRYTDDGIASGLALRALARLRAAAEIEAAAQGTAEPEAGAGPSSGPGSGSEGEAAGTGPAEAGGRS